MMFMGIQGHTPPQCRGNKALLKALLGDAGGS